MNHFKNISEQEYKDLLKLPVYISMLAANTIGYLDKKERKTAIQFAHTKTFICDPRFAEFYNDVEKVIIKNIEKLEKDLPKGKKSRNEAIRKEILMLNTIVLKLGDELASTMRTSMKSFTDHILKAHYNIITDFIYTFLPI